MGEDLRHAGHWGGMSRGGGPLVLGKGGVEGGVSGEEGKGTDGEGEKAGMHWKSCFHLLNMY